MNSIKSNIKIKLFKTKQHIKNLREKVNTKINSSTKFNFKSSNTLRKPNYKFMFMFPMLYIPQIAYLAEEEEEKKESTELEMKDIVRGEYENKIRTFSSIEKRFLIFAKIKKYGDYRMTYFQFLDSLVPFQYIKTKNSDEISKILNENENFQKVLKKIDINNDGFINFEEFIILSIVMSTSLNEYQASFPTGKLTREQLAEFLMNKISQLEALKITSKSFVDGRIIKTDYNTLYRYMVDFVSLVFKNTVIDINKDLSQFLFEVYLLMLFYEFFRVPSENKKISMENFAKVLMSYVNIYKNKHIKKKIEDKLINLQGDVSFDEYVSFFWFLKGLHNDKAEVFKKGQLNLEDLKKIADEKLKNMPTAGFKIKKGISQRQLQLLIDIFDENGKKLFQI
jgi:hypothetical protein